MRFKGIILQLAVVLASSSAAFASTSACPEHYVDGQPPVITNSKLAVETRELCNQGYGVIHSGVTRTPVVGGELLTRERLEQGRGLPRTNSFRPDFRLATKERAELSDYARSGYDRGHLVSPSADSFSSESQEETFLLSNMIPQDPDNNRHLHEGIEHVVRKEAKKRGKLYVVTGTLYSGGELKRLKGRVIVPTGIYKCVFDPRRQEAGCYVENNAPGMEYKVVSVKDVEELAGIDIYPGVPASVKASAMRLPVPKPYRGRGGQ